MLPKIHIFFHCYTGKDWEHITRSLLCYVANHEVNATLIGDRQDELRLRAIGKKFNIAINVRSFEQDEVYEHEVFSWISENARLNPEDYTLYFHTKGAGNSSELNDYWRINMVYYFLSGWKKWFRKLVRSKLEACGPWFGYHDSDEEFGGQISRFFAGNFWMAKNSYIASLPDYRSLKSSHQNSRYLPERYIGLGNPKVLLVNQEKVLPVTGADGIQWKILEGNDNLKAKRKLFRKYKLNQLFVQNAFIRKIAQNVKGGEPQKSPNLKLAIVIHVFYLDVMNEILRQLDLCGYHSDILITCPPELELDIVSVAGLMTKNDRKIEVFPMENRGRDILPFLRMGNKIMSYDLVCKLHTKKSDYSPELSGWRDYLIGALLGSEKTFWKNIAAFEKDENLGVLSPGWFKKYSGKKYDWGSNKERSDELLKSLGFGIAAPSKTTFPAGSMFWFRPAALKSLLAKKEILDDFEEEAGQLDGTLAHAVERIIHVVAEANGYKVKIL